MTRRRAKIRRFQGKMAKLKLANGFNWPQLGRLKKSLLVLYVLTFVVLVGGQSSLSAHQDLMSATATTRWNVNNSAPQSRSSSTVGSIDKSSSSSLPVNSMQSARKPRRLTTSADQRDNDPMEPCYLANNRASETLTISESTPVGTVVGEIMVIGALENIELSIRMPGGGGGGGSIGAAGHIPADDFVAPTATSTQPNQSSATAATNGHYAAQTWPIDLARRSGLLRNLSPTASNENNSTNKLLDGDRSSNQAVEQATGSARANSGPKIVRGLSEKIDLMPPLSLEQGTKRLILAKKLDRENLDKYLHSTSSSSSSTSSQSSSSSASLTVHVKCQLKTTRQPDASTMEQHSRVNGTGEPSGERNSTQTRLDSTGKRNEFKELPKSSKTTVNSILIPIHLIITDENDNWPNFSSGPYIIDLNESAPVGSLLQNNEILAFDEDQPGPLSTIEYSIVPGSFWSDSFAFLNPLDSRSLIVKENRLLDFESQPKIMLKVMARDQGDPPNWAITSLFVNLLDQDDTNPVFNEDKYLAFIRDNRPGEKLDLMPKRMVAIDGDRQLSAPISYSFYMKTNQTHHFDLDSDLGQLTLRKSFDDKINQAPFCLLIKASQVDNPRRWSLTAVTIQLNGGSSSSNRPTFSKKSANSNLDSNTDSSQQSRVFGFGQVNYTLEVSESAQVGATIFTARANLGNDDLVNYELLDNDLNYLEIDQISGRVKLNKLLDYEMFRKISVRILATSKLIIESQDATRNDHDQHYDTRSKQLANTRLVCDITRLNINVLNFNDFAPEFSHDQYNFQLSISDLIANFEPSPIVTSGQTQDGPVGQWNGLKLARRSGELELNVDDEILDDFDQRAIQLGQVYCADRDHDDRVSLKLTGSKANLFHLAQDGRLYLPLINVSSANGAAVGLSGGGGGAEAKVNQRNSINNQLAINRIFANLRRNDPEQRGQDSLDRAYLNHLLAELSQLGRLRLKVHANDQGQPEAKRSTALIVISIISIDNFIIQRSASSLASSMLLSNLNSNKTLYQQNTSDTPFIQNDLLEEGGREQVASSNGGGGQMMMIPSMNGKSFVHINADIIGNLLTSAVSTRMASAQQTQGRDQSDPLELSSSNTISNSLINSRHLQQQQTSTLNGERSNKPPGLLLVDEDGAKFVAMPTAMEVYNRHVKEASLGQQQARLKTRQQQQQQRPQSDGPDEAIGESKLPWYYFGKKLNSTNADNGGLMQWVNLSTAIALHLIVIVCILSLATRFRLRLFGLDSGGGGGRVGAAGSEASSQMGASQPNSVTSLNITSEQQAHNRWPKRISNLGSFFVDKQRRDETAGSMLNGELQNCSIVPNSPPNTIVGQYSSSSVYSQQLPNQNRLEQHRDYQTDQHHDQLKSTTSSCKQSIVSSGALVSAKSSGQLRALTSANNNNNNNNNEQHLAELTPEAKSHQQNLFEHLKLTLDKMLDTENGPTANCMGKGGSKLSVLQPAGELRDADFGHQRDCQLEVCAVQFKETNELSVSQSKRSPVEKTSAISTFVGAQVGREQRLNKTHHQMAMQHNKTTNRLAPTVVSINVGAPKQSIGRENEIHNSTSSNSSTVSLVSMASSLSNKISEAVVQADNLNHTGSESTSLNSSILLQAGADFADTSSDSTVNRRAREQRKVFGPTNKQPPVPPPLPPPPSLVRATPSNGGHIKPNKTAQSTRQAQPENPLHLRLRRDDQLLSVMGNGNNQLIKCDQNDDDYLRRENEIGSQNAASRANNVALGGRRETRVGQQQKQMLRTSVMKARDQPATQKPTTSPNKTVSPTTSVDRGYESFQSFGAGGVQANGVQFSSLQEYCLASNCDNFDCDRFATSLPESNLGRRVNRMAANSTGPGSGRAHRNGQTINAIGASSSGRAQRRLVSSPTQTTVKTKVARPKLNESSSSRVEFCNGTSTGSNRLDCDTEDDDFYYYCGESMHDDEHHQVGCFNYSCHAYNQQMAPATYQTEPIQPTPNQMSPRRATGLATTTTTTTSGRKQAAHKTPDLRGGQLRAANNQACDMPTKSNGRRTHRPGPSPSGGRQLQKASGGQSSQLASGEIGVKRLTWSDQVH